jgi:hypothetical protein
MALFRVERNEMRIGHRFVDDMEVANRAGTRVDERLGGVSPLQPMLDNSVKRISAKSMNFRSGSGTS